MLHIGRAGHPGPGERHFTPGQLSVEFVFVGGWLTCGALAMDSCAQFLVVAEYRLIPSRARSIGHLLRKAGHQYFGPLPVRIRLLVVMQGLGWSAWVPPLLLRLPLLPLLLRSSSGWVERCESLSQLVTEEWLICLSFMGIRGRRRILRSCSSLLSFCNPAVVPCLAKAISAGRFVDLALTFSLGEGKRPAATCKVKLDDCSGTRGDFIFGCFDALAASTACKVTDRWFPPHFSLFSTFGADEWSGRVLLPHCFPASVACMLD